MGHAALAEEPDYFRTDMPVGDILRRARVHYNQSITDVERALRIRASQIDAIESGKLEQLPGHVYAIGFVRSYAEYLGLDGDRMIRLFKEQSSGVEEKPELHFLVAASESKLPALWIILASFAVAVGILIFWAALQQDDRSMVTDIPAVPAALKAEIEKSTAIELPYGPPAPTQQQMAVTVSEEVTAQVKAEPPVQKGLILQIQQNSWVEIKNESGKAIVSRVLKAGDQYYVPDSPNLKMSLGNAGGVAVLLDGQALPALGRPGEIRRDIPLGREALQNLSSGLE